MTTATEVVAEARRWLGVPFLHQGRTRNGCDCGGLVGGVAVALGIVPADWWERVFDPMHAGYSRQPSNGTLASICEAFMGRSEAPQPGDVVLMRFDTEPQHLAVVTDYRHGGLAVVHALASAGRVVEHRFSPLWQGRVTAVYRFPGV